MSKYSSPGDRPFPFLSSQADSAFSSTPHHCSPLCFPRSLSCLLSSAHRSLLTMSAGSSGASKQRGSKPKGAVRAKSGCYTCRIRRKVPFYPVRRVSSLTDAHQKCDEKMDNEGSCQTCARLRLQCLGFGAKRPDWMRVCPFILCMPLVCGSSVFHTGGE